METLIMVRKTCIDAIYHFFAHNDWEFKEVQILPIMIKAGMIQMMEIILLSRMTILMNADLSVLVCGRSVTLELSDGSSGNYS
jgi:hypothetical protein